MLGSRDSGSGGIYRHAKKKMEGDFCDPVSPGETELCVLYEKLKVLIHEAKPQQEPVITKPVQFLSKQHFPEPLAMGTCLKPAEEFSHRTVVWEALIRVPARLPQIERWRGCSEFSSVLPKSPVPLEPWKGTLFGN